MIAAGDGHDHANHGNLLHFNYI